MSKSFAIWGCRDYRSNSSSTYNPERNNFINELHINFWNISAHKFCYLDFGITFKNLMTTPLQIMVQYAYFTI